MRPVGTTVSSAPVIPPYLLAALSGTVTITVSDRYDPIDLELSAFANRRGASRELASQQAIRDVQLRFADVISCAGERQRTRILEDLMPIARDGTPQVVNVPFGLSEPPPASSERPLRDRLPAIGARDPLVLWWGKVWIWFDAETAIRAFELVVQRRPDERLVISAGKAPSARADGLAATEEARQLASRLGLLDQSIFFLDEWTRRCAVRCPRPRKSAGGRRWFSHLRPRSKRRPRPDRAPGRCHELSCALSAATTHAGRLITPRSDPNGCASTPSRDPLVMRGTSGVEP